MNYGEMLGGDYREETQNRCMVECLILDKSPSPKSPFYANLTLHLHSNDVVMHNRRYSIN
jgi:hypothetical protein